MNCKKYYPFVWENSQLIFDWDSKVLHVKFVENKREYKKDLPLEAFPVHSFYTIAGYIHICGEQPPGQAEYKLTSEGIVMDFFPATKPRKGEKALIKFQDDQEMIYTRFFFNQLRLKAFIDMLEAVDKTISVAEIPEGRKRSEVSVPPDKEILLTKADGEVYIEDVHIPIPDRSALYEVLRKIAIFGDTYPMKTTYERARIVVAGNIFELFKKEGRNFIPVRRLKLKRDDALRMMCVINPLR